MNYSYHCPMCGGLIYNDTYFGQNLSPNYQQAYYPNMPVNNHLVQRFDSDFVSPQEFPRLKGKKIQTTIPNLGTITACVGNYDPNSNRVELSDIIAIHTGVNHGAMDYNPADLTGLKVISETCQANGPATGDGGRPPISEDELSKTTVIRKTITSFGVPDPKWDDPFHTRTYRVYLEVTVPIVIRDQAQEILDRCMTNATNILLRDLAPFLTPATYGGLPGAIPAALEDASQTFALCVGSNPIIYPYINRIKLNVGAGFV